MVQFVGLLIAVALTIKLFWWIVGIVAATVVVVKCVKLSRRLADRHVDGVEAERRRLAGIATRADEQHRWTLAGDDRGVFGEYPPDSRVGKFPSIAM